MNSASLTVGAVLANAARATPVATAVYLDGAEHSFADLDAAGRSVAEQLLDAGIVPGDVVLALADTSFDLMAHFFGCALSGAVFVPANPWASPDALAAVVTTISPTMALAPPGVTDTLPAGLPRSWFDTDRAPDGRELPTVSPDDAHIAYLTSGSTGTPKAVLVSHGTSVLRSHPGAQLEHRGPALCPYPMFHMAGWTISLQQWHARAATVYVNATDPDTLCDALRSFEIERFNAVPALWSRLADHLGTDAPNAFPALRFADTGTSPTSAELLATIATLAPHAQVRVFYGSSEAGNVASLPHHMVAAKPGSCGTSSVLSEVKIGADDELLIRGPLLFDRYLGAPETTATALRDGWFHTGDQASLDADGYLTITGRLGTLIRTGGEAVAPDVVETAIRSHPDVGDVAVFGAPDAQWGEVVTAAVVSHSEISLDELREHVSDRLARHEVPRRVLHLDQIPRTAATQQVDRSALRSLAAATDVT